MTEFGWVADYRSPTYAADQARQAQNLQTTYTVLRTTPYVTRGYWFSVQDVEDDVVLAVIEQLGVAAEQLAEVAADRFSRTFLFRHRLDLALS